MEEKKVIVEVALKSGENAEKTFRWSAHLQQVSRNERNC